MPRKAKDVDKADQPRRTSPGCLTHIVLYLAITVPLYLWSTPVVTENFTEGQQRHFYVAAVQRSGGEPGKAVGISLYALKQGAVDTSKFTFLLPEAGVEIDAGGDPHSVEVLERHADWQLVRYHYENTSMAVSKYRAFDSRIEPVSYRDVANAFMFMFFVMLILPVAIVSAVINAVWRWSARRRKR